MRERQLLLRVLKLYIVINDTQVYELREQEPLLITCDILPIRLVAHNGFHFSKPLYLRKHFDAPQYIGVGCEADNGRLWGAVLFSVLLFILFMVTGLRVFMILANVPLFYILYKFYIKAKEFITLEKMKVNVKTVKPL